MNHAGTDAAGEETGNGRALEDELTARVQRQARVFNTTLSSIVDFAYIFGRDGRFLYANQALLDLLGIPLDAIVGKNFFDLRYPDDLAGRLQRQIEHVFNTGEVVRDETPYTSPSGKQGVYEYIFTPVRQDDGSIEVVAGSTRDVTTRKANESALEALVAREKFLVRLDDVLRPLADAEEITYAAAALLGEHLNVNRCAYATVDEDQDAFSLTGNYTAGVPSIVGRYRFRQFGEECLRLMRAGEPYVVVDSTRDPRIDETDLSAYVLTMIRAVICVPILKAGQFVAAMAVHVNVPRDWQPAEVQLVQRVAGRCWESIERARLTRNLTESEGQFRQLANSMANLAWTAAPDGAINWYNDQWYAYTGTTAAEMEGWGWTSVHDPGALPEVLTHWKASIARGTAFEMVFPIRGRDGTFRRFLTRANPLRNSRDEVVRWFGTNTDVETERRATESLLEAEHERKDLLRREQLAREDAELQKRLLYSLFMQAPTLIAILRGPDHVVELANPRICELWGHDLDELKDRSLFDVMPELRDQVFKSLLDEVFATGVPYFGMETPAQFDRGEMTETVYSNFVYSPFRSVQGEIEGIFLIASDVTEQIRSRQEVDGLRQAAEAANRAKDEFLAMLGHELRNPLSPILTALQLMKLRGGDGNERERTVIERQVNHLTRLVDDLLDVSRIAQGKVELRSEVVELSEVVAKAVEQASPLLEERRHRLVLDVPPEGLLVEGDPTRLAQIVSNLLSNAAKYTDAGGVVSVRARNIEGDIVLEVSDTGIGIAPETLPRIFDLFVQERQGSDRAQGGLGLGLAIVRSLVERHGGRVSARSDGYGRGSAFTVWLPAARVAASQVDVRETALAPVVGGAASRRILVVDDNEDGALMLAHFFSASGHETRVAYDAPGALETARSFLPEVAFLDIGLPVMNGYELAERLRELPGLEQITLVALTGYGQESDRVRSRAAGFHHHLVKPVDLDALGRLLVRPDDE
jgi:PAS domain S-box-containing protein